MSDGLDVGVLATGEVGAHGLPAKAQFGIKIGKRTQDEGAFADAGVWQDKARMVKVQVVVGKQVKIEGARRIFKGALTVLLLLYALQEVKQRQRCEVAAVADDGVDEIRLRGVTPRRGSVECRCAALIEVRGEVFARPQELGDGVALVAAVGDPDGMHGLFYLIYVLRKRGLIALFPPVAVTAAAFARGGSAFFVFALFGAVLFDVGGGVRVLLEGCPQFNEVGEVFAGALAHEEEVVGGTETRMGEDAVHFADVAACRLFQTGL